MVETGATTKHKVVSFFSAPVCRMESFVTTITTGLGSSPGETQEWWWDTFALMESFLEGIHSFLFFSFFLSQK